MGYLKYVCPKIGTDWFCDAVLLSIDSDGIANCRPRSDCSLGAVLSWPALFA